MREVEKLAFSDELRYNQPMLEDLEKELKAREIAHLQAMESNPFDAEDIAMFEMFGREGYTAEQRRDFMIAKAKHGDTSAE